MSVNSAWAEVTVATAIAWAGAFGAVIVRQAGTKVMRAFVYLALLFFALIAIFDILPESRRSLSWPWLLGSVAVGYGLFWLIGKYVAPICPACAMRHFEDGHHHAHGSGLVALAIVLVVHCLIDGLGVSAASSLEAGFGFRLLAAISAHKLPEGFALAMMLMTGARSPWTAFALAVAIEASTLAGAAIGMVWTHLSPFWLGILLAQIAGTFLYLSISGLQDALMSRAATSRVITETSGSSTG